MNPTETYMESGFVKVPGFLGHADCHSMLDVVKRFHSLWLTDNLNYYHQGVINSSNLTRTGILSEPDRLRLFNLICCEPLLSLVRPLLNTRPRFIGTQLFFDPHNPEQSNYWHRDGQYHLDLDQQQRALAEQQVLHCRIALVPERGVELMPGTHKRWDTERELAVRLERDGCKKSDDLPNSQKLALETGDLLIFSANMLHRGLYGNDRYALDILICDDQPELTAFIQPDSLPNKAQLTELSNPEIFL